ncbi:MAG TPA: chemotaxis protein CheB [Thermoanaerobaculia bacterium]
MDNDRIVLIGTSAGGVKALTHLVAGLPKNFPAPVLIVQHTSPHGPSAMPAILSRSGPLRAIHPRDGERIRPGRIYIAPPNRHLLLSGDAVRLSLGPAENHNRPAIDVLFRSGARTYGNRAIGVVLTGNLDDGTAGLAEIKRSGGTAIVQDPDDAEYPDMPRNAIGNVDVDRVAPLDAIPRLLVELAGAPRDPLDSGEQNASEMKEDLERGEDRESGEDLSGFTCPDCGGALWESDEGGVLHFRCRTGHAFSPESLAAGQTETMEAALWAAVRSLEESAALSQRMEHWARDRQHAASLERYTKRTQEAKQHAEVLRRFLVDGPPLQEPG